MFVGLRQVIQILCHVLARGWGRCLRYFTGPKHDTRFAWPVSILIMTRNPSFPFKNSQNKCQKSSFTYDRRRHLILPLPPMHTLPTLNARTCCWGAPIDDVTLSYVRWHGQFESLVNASCQSISMWYFRMVNNENSINLSVDSLQAPQIQIVCTIVWGFLSGDRQWDHVLLLINKP